MLHPVLKKLSCILSCFNRLCNDNHRISDSCIHNTVSKRQEELSSGCTSVFKHKVSIDVSVSRSHALIKYAKSVSHRAIGHLGYFEECSLCSIYTVSFGYSPHSVDKFSLAYTPEIKLHASGPYCLSYLLRISCRENENRMLRWFLKSLKECILSLLSKHMNLVYDVHLVSSDAWRILHQVNERPEVFNPVV